MTARPCRARRRINIIHRAMGSRAMSEREGTLYVLALGALTNVASAILIEPRIRERVCVVALGGWPRHASDFRDFNFLQGHEGGRRRCSIAASRWCR